MVAAAREAQGAEVVLQPAEARVPATRRHQPPIGGIPPINKEMQSPLLTIQAVPQVPDPQDHRRQPLAALVTVKMAVQSVHPARVQVLQSNRTRCGLKEPPVGASFMSPRVVARNAAAKNLPFICTAPESAPRN